MARDYREGMGERIRQRRDELGLSRADLARELPGKTNENAIYRWEKGEHEPRPDTVEALAAALKLSVQDLLAPAPEPGNGNTPDPFAGQNGLAQHLTQIRNVLEQNHRALELIMLKLGINLPDAPAGGLDIPTDLDPPDEDAQQAG